MHQSAATIVCSGCGQKIRIPAEHFGEAGRCPKCKTGFAAIGRAQAATRSWSAYTNLVCWGYLVFISLAALVIRGASERWTLGTLLLFSPHWLLVAPLVVLVPLAIMVKRTALLPLVAGGFAYLVLIAGFF